MSRPSRIAIVKELGARTPRCLAAHAVRGNDEPELVVVERYPAVLGVEVLALIEEDAKALVSLEHANIASLISTARLKGDVAVLSEWVDGESLADVLAAEPEQKPGLDVLLRIFADVLEALGALHASGDRICGALTPEDIFVGVDGVTRVTRFALGRVGPKLLGENRITYMAPELAQGERSPRGDVFTAGVLLWECFMGEVPSRGAMSGIRPADTSKREPWAAGLVDVIRKACSVDKAARYETPGEMGHAITSALTDAGAKIAARAAVSQHVARVFGERIAARLARLEPKVDVAFASMSAPPTTDPPPAVEPTPPAKLPEIIAALPPPLIAASEPVTAAPMNVEPLKLPVAEPVKVREPPVKPVDPPAKALSPKAEKVVQGGQVGQVGQAGQSAQTRKPKGGVPDATSTALARKAVPLPKLAPKVAQSAPANANAKSNGDAKAHGTPAKATVPQLQLPQPPELPELPEPPEPKVVVEDVPQRPERVDDAPPPSHRDEIDVDIDLVSVRPPPMAPMAPAPPKRRKSVPPAPQAAATAAFPLKRRREVYVEAPEAEADVEAPPQRSRAWIIVACGLLFFGGGFALGRMTATDPAPREPVGNSVPAAPAAPTAPSVTPSAATTTSAGKPVR